MVVADLHVHTTSSDGSMTLSEIPAAAERAGVSVVAITDHDRLHPDLRNPVVHRDGVTLLSGIELRVETNDERVGRVDLLGYGARRTDPLADEIDRLQRDRIERGRAIIDCVEDHLVVDLAIEPREGIGRPHVARAVADHADADYGYQDAFDHLIGGDCPCYVARDVPDFDRGVGLLREACGLVGLAHPHRYDDVGAALDLTRELDAVELHYPYDREVDSRPVERAIRERGLVATGGSDAHDDRLGRAGLSLDEYRVFRDHVRLGG